jgi:hypothetical protein
VRNRWRRSEVLVGELELDTRVVVQDLYFVDGAPGGENGGHLLRANQFRAEARTLISGGGRRDAKRTKEGRPMFRASWLQTFRSRPGGTSPQPSN